MKYSSGIPSFSSVRFTIFCLASVMLLSLSGCATREGGPASRPSAPRPVSPAMVLKVVQTAQKQTGTAYRLGGDSPQKGFDCSGLIYWSFRQHGIEVPRLTRDQAKAGVAVSRNRLRPGDIMVFRMPEAPNGLHTGLYIGQDQFIHSPNSKSKVRVEAMSDYWSKRFLTARRITHTQPRR